MSILSGMRPSIAYGVVWCGQCNQACDFDESAMHDLFGKPDGAGNHRGYILIRAYCHNEERDIKLTFQQARDNAGKRILAWEGAPALESPTASLQRAALPAPALLLMDKGQNYWTRPVVHAYRIQRWFAPVDESRVAAFAFIQDAESETDFDRQTREIIDRYEKRNRR